MNKRNYLGNDAGISSRYMMHQGHSPAALVAQNLIDEMVMSGSAVTAMLSLQEIERQDAISKIISNSGSTCSSRSNSNLEFESSSPKPLSFLAGVANLYPHLLVPKSSHDETANNV